MKTTGAKKVSLVRDAAYSIGFTELIHNIVFIILEKK